MSTQTTKVTDIVNVTKSVTSKQPKSVGTRNRLANLGNRAGTFKPGVSGNPGGRPKRDLAAELSRAVFEQDPTALGEALFQGLKRGNGGMARMFQVLSDRGYGKLTEHLQVDATIAAGVADRLASARRRVKPPPPPPTEDEA